MLLNEAATATAPENGGKRGFVAARDDDRSDHHDRIQSVGERHQRRVQQRRHSLDHFKSHEPRQNEDITGSI